MKMIHTLNISIKKTLSIFDLFDMKQIFILQDSKVDKKKYALEEKVKM